MSRVRVPEGVAPTAEPASERSDRIQCVHGILHSVANRFVDSGYSKGKVAKNVSVEPESIIVKGNAGNCIAMVGS